MEKMSDVINKNAVLVLKEKIESDHVPSNEQLDKLAGILEVRAFYIINRNGHFFRSSDIPIKDQIYSFFTFVKPIEIYCGVI